jgi:hypothetical protein
MRYAPLTIALGFSLVTALVPRSASALISNTYDPRSCLAKHKVENDALVRTVSNNIGKIQNTTGGPVTIFCPITKTTSGPGITNDQIWDAAVPAQDPSNLGVSCGIEVFQTPNYIDDAGQLDNFVESNWMGVTGNGTITIGFESDFGSPSGYWTGNGGPPSWYYANISCVLPNNASITNYTIRENGTVQSKRIFTASNCADQGNSHWRYLDKEGDPSELMGGSIYADASGGSGLQFRFKCPVPANSVVQLALGPALTPQVIGCSYNNSASPQTWPVPSLSSNTAVIEYAPFSGSPFIVVGSGTNNLICDIQPATGNGDGRIDTYRAELGTIATAFAGTPGNAIDHNTGSRWTGGTAQASGQWFKIDLQSAKKFNKVVMNSTGSNNDYAHHYKIETSNDDHTYTQVFSGNGSGAVVTSTFTATTARYVKVTLTGSDTGNHWWSMYEVSVFAN